MATTTTNLGLVKPSYTETADISVINSNFDTIDSAIGSLQDSVDSMQDRIVVQGEYCYTVGSWSGAFDWYLEGAYDSSIGKNPLVKNQRYLGASLGWYTENITVNGVALTERSHTDDHMFDYGDNASQLATSVYGSNSDGDYKVTACYRPSFSSDTATHAPDGPSSKSVYFWCIKGVNAYRGCYAWMQFEIYAASGGSPVGIYSLSDIQHYSRKLGYVETL